MDGSQWQASLIVRFAEGGIAYNAPARHEASQHGALPGRRINARDCVIRD